MAELVLKAGIVREPGFLYFLSGTAVARTPMKGRRSTAGKGREVIKQLDFVREDGFMYYIDKQGDIARAPRRVGGVEGPRKRKRKKASAVKAAPAKRASAKKAPAKKTAKKTTAKKTTAKKTTAKKTATEKW